MNDYEKVYDILVDGNMSYTGEEILKKLNENGFYIVKSNNNIFSDGNGRIMKILDIEIVKTLNYRNQ